MKSPNFYSSVKNLKMAAKLIRNAWEDLKNSEEIRAKDRHTTLRLIEIQLNDLRDSILEEFAESILEDDSKGE